MLTCIHRAQHFDRNSQPDEIDEDPFRMIRLLHATVRDGNSETALLLAQGTMGSISVDALSDCLVSLIDRFATLNDDSRRRVKPSTGNRADEVEVMVRHLRDSIDLEVVRSKAVLKALSTEPKLKLPSFSVSTYSLQNKWC